MKTIKIKYIGFWSGFNPEEFKMTKILQKHFNVEICDDADYIITSCFGLYDFLDYSQVRIEYIGENYIPDLNMIDYAISPYPIKLFDRCFHLPQGLDAFENSCEINAYCAKRHTIKFDKDFIKGKTVFANFCAGHESENNVRGDFFKKLCEYKKVDSIGSYLNNTGVHVNFKNGTKQEYQRKCKFTLCFVAYGVAKPLAAYLLRDSALNVQENVAMLVGMCLFVGLNYLGQRFFAFSAAGNEDNT